MFLLALAGAVLVSGGSPEQQQAVRDSYERVPDCLREPAGPIELMVVPGSLNAIYDPDFEAATGGAWPIDRLDPTKELAKEVSKILGEGSIAAAKPKKKPPPRPVEHMIGVFDRILVAADRLADESAAEGIFCAPAGSLEPFFGDLDRILLHEVAHSWHFDRRGGGGQFDVDRFLDIRWREAYDEWSEDPERLRIHEEYKGAQEAVLDEQAAHGEASPATLEAVCALQAELEARYREMPSRFPGDFHAFTNPNGAEYFAIALETLAYAPDVFCASYSPEEIAFIKDVLGRCLAELKRRAPCYEAMPAAGSPNANTTRQGKAGLRRD